ncbi:MAG: hypothetical protein WCJ25_03630, partial [Candidatus Moraniibacteriota bacterium]
TFGGSTLTELGYLSGATGSLQNQLDNKAPLSHTHSASDITSGILGVTHGGTGTATRFTQGSILFAGVDGVYLQDNAGFFYDSVNGRVGIGTKTPQKTLDIVGNASVTNDIQAGSFSITNGGTIGVLDANISMSTSVVPTVYGLNLGSSDHHWANVYADNLSVGATNVNGTSSPYFIINSVATSDEAMGLRFYRSLANGYAALSWNPVQSRFDLFKREDTGVLADLRLATLSADNVGIGTTSPGAKLEIVGTDSAIPLLIKNTGSGAGSYAGMQFTDAAGNLMGHMGYANVSARNFPDQFYFGSIAAKDFNITTTDTIRMTIKAGGNVGIGTTSPTEKLEVVGNAIFSGDVKVNSLSVTNGASIGSLGLNISMNSSLIPSTSGLNLGSSSNHWANLYADNLSVGTLDVVNSNASGTSSQYFTINSAASSEQDMGVRFYRGSVPNGYAALKYNGTNQDFTLYKKEGDGTLANLNLASLYTSGNVGIGTTTPAYLLDVAGNVNIATGSHFKINGTNLSYTDVGAQVAGSYLTSLSGAVLTDQTTPQTIGSTGSRLSKLWATDIAVTNAITGDITGNAGTVTNGVYTNGSYSDPAWLTSLNASKLTTGTGAVSLAAGGTNQNVTLTPSGSGYTLLNGNVGIGTTSPSALLSVGATSQFQVNATGAIAAATGITSSGTITLSGLNTAGIVTNTSAGVLGTVSIVPVANGGTGTATAFTQGSLIFAGASGTYTQDNANLYYNATNHWLGIGTIPTVALQVAGATSIFGAGEASASPSSGTLRAPNATGANIRGGDLTLQAGNGTGSGGSGAISFMTAPSLLGGPSVTYDTAASAGLYCAGTTVTVSLTVGNNSSRVVIADIISTLGGAPTSAAYAGSAMTLLQTDKTSTHFVYYLLSPSTGTNNLVVTFPSSCGQYAVGGTSFYNVNQSSPFGPVSVDDGTGTSSTLSIGSSNTSVVYDSIMGGRGMPVATPGSGFTQVVNYRGGTIGGVSVAYAPGATSVNATETLASSFSYGHVAFSINNVGAGSMTDSLATAMSITNTGNVGIGTTAPAYLLDVAGNVNIATGSHFKINGTNLSYTDVGAQVAGSYLTSLSGAVLTDQTTPQTIGSTGSRLSKLWATDIAVTNAITGDITGNAGTVTNGVYTNAANSMTLINPLTTLAESWIGPSSTSGIYFKGGNVGIGTTSPAYKLSTVGLMGITNPGIGGLVGGGIRFDKDSTPSISWSIGGSNAAGIVTNDLNIGQFIREIPRGSAPRTPLRNGLENRWFSKMS